MSQFIRIWSIALVVKIFLAIWLPLSNDEAYYWVWGHHPQWSYFDHPPMVGWLFWLGTWIENFGSAARVPGVLLGHLTLLVWHEILRPFLDSKKLTLWLVFVLFSPLLGAGSLIITPDVPLVFFWSLSLLVLLKLLENPKPTSYATFGAALGLGFCSKYMIVLFVPIAIAWILWSGKWRAVKWQLVPLTILFGLLFCTPVLYWNWQNEWASFAFQLNHGLVGHKWRASIPLEYLLGQIGLLFPIVFVLALRRREPKEAQFLHFFGWLPLAFFLYTSFKAPVEANWPIMGHPAILSLAILNVTNWSWVKATVGIWIVAILLILSELIHPWVPIDPKRLKTREFTKFDVFMPFAEKAKSSDDYELYLGSYQMAATVSYRMRHQFYKLGGMNRKDFYDFQTQSYPKSDRFFVGAERGHPLPTWLTEKGFSVQSTTDLTDEFRILEVSRDAQTSDR